VAGRELEVLLEGRCNSRHGKFSSLVSKTVKDKLAGDSGRVSYLVCLYNYSNNN